MPRPLHFPLHPFLKYSFHPCTPRPPVHIGHMIRILPIVLAVLFGLALYCFSAWRTAKELDEKSTELLDPALREMTSKLASALDLPRMAPVNGLAAPDGRIFITRGFYDKFRSGAVTAEELASVIAHELGHVALGHSRRRMIDFSGQNAMRAALGMIWGALSRVSASGSPTCLRVCWQHGYRAVMNTRRMLMPPLF